MLQAQRKGGRGQKVQTKSNPAPIGGLNAHDSLAAMPANDAVILDNFFPTPTTVDLRNGSASWVKGFPASIESLMPYNNGTNSILFAAAGNSFYNATASGQAGAPVVTDLSNARWQHINVGTPGGQFLYAVNGADFPEIFDGTNWQKLSGLMPQPISSITHNGATATVTTTIPHNLPNGAIIGVSGVVPSNYNGAFIITVISPIAFTYNTNIPAINSITASGTTATLTTISAHGLSTGNSVTVSGAQSGEYNGTYNVTVTSTTTFTYLMASAPALSASQVGVYTVNQSVSPVPISTITFSGTTATVTTTAIHGMATGNVITVSGASPTTYNGSFTITFVSPTSFSYTMLSNPATSATVVGSYIITKNNASIVHSGVFATYTTAVPHNLSSGNAVQISGATTGEYNGIFAVVVTGTNVFTYQMATAPAADATAVGTFLEIPITDATTIGSYAIVQRIVSISDSGLTATVTTFTPHGLFTGNQVIMSGTTPSAYNGSFNIVVMGPNTFTYKLAETPGSSPTVIGSFSLGISISGVDPTNLININSYKNRVYLIENNSFHVWYLPVTTIGGAASLLDMSPLFLRGGYLMAMMTWTIDDSSGINQYAVFISSEGEIVMYSGSDPSNPNDFAIVGTFYVGRPIGRRCHVKIGSDIIILSTDGFFPLSKALLTDRSQLNDAISDKIVNLVNNDVALYKGNFGWEGCLYSLGNKVLVNVPQQEGQKQYQYVMNTITGAWCRFTNWNANCFAVMQDILYYGGNLSKGSGSATVYQADVGHSDDGTYILGEVKTAFQYFDALGYQKHFTMVRPIIYTAGSVQISLAIDVDFEDSTPIGTPTFSGTAGTPWDVGAWNTFPWGDLSSINKDWQSVTAIGTAGALHMRVVNNKTQLQWQSVDYAYETQRQLTP